MTYNHILFTTTEEDLLAFLEDDSCYSYGLLLQQFPHADISGIDPDRIENLSVILGVRPVGKETKNYRLVREMPDDGLWVIRFTTELQQRLASLPADKIQEIAEFWADTDDDEMLDLDELTTTLLEMSGLAKEALNKGTPIFLWLSL